MAMTISITKSALLISLALNYPCSAAAAPVGSHGRRKWSLRPKYHFTPLRNFMNDPNGLTYSPDGTLHMFYQYNPNGTVPSWANESQPYAHWGHALSKNLVNFSPAHPSTSDIIGSSGGAVYLPDNLYATSGFRAVAFAGRNGSQMWTSADSSLSHWKYSSDSDISKNASRLIPRKAAGNPGRDVGDNGAWLAEDKKSVYVLFGGFSKEHGPQALLFRSISPDLMKWEFVSTWYTGTKDDGTKVQPNCPDAFPLGQNRWAFMWLAHPTWHDPYINIWMIGTVDPIKNVFNMEYRGLADQSSSFIAAQSLTWIDGRRVQYSWVETPVADGSVGAQTMARRVALSNDGTKLLFYPVKEVEEVLHEGEAVLFRNVTLYAQGIETILLNGSKAFGQTIHIKISVQLPPATSGMANASFGVSVLNGRLKIMFVRRENQLWFLDVPGFTRNDEPHSNLKVDTSGRVLLDVFVDRSVVEVFVSDSTGEGAIAVTCSVNTENMTKLDDGLSLSWVGTEDAFSVKSVQVWNMGPACPWS